MAHRHGRHRATGRERAALLFWLLLLLIILFDVVGAILLGAWFIVPALVFLGLTWFVVYVELTR